jgi:hypothetical protein
MTVYCPDCTSICEPAQPSVYEQKHATLVAYLNMKVDESDWHGVSDAANDLRVMEAKK